MIITCGNCHARFKVELELIKETGSRVRCSNCRFVFTVFRPQGGTPETIVETTPVEPPQPSEPPRPPEDPNTTPPGNSDRTPPKGLDEDPLEKLLAELEDLEKPADRREPLPTEPPPYWDRDDDQEEPEPLRNRAGRPSRLKNADTRRGPDREDFNPHFLEEDLDLEEPFGEEAVNSSYPPLNEPDLGLAVSPTEPEKVFSQAATSQRPGGRQTAAGLNRARLLLIAAVAAAFLGIGIFFLSNRPESVALFSGDQAAVEGEYGENQTSAALQSDLEGRNLLGLVQGKLVHHYRANQEAGELLVLIGQVRNEYPDHRSFIRLNGKLYSPEHVVLAERPVYAGNLLTDEELTTLPIGEIYSRLSIKGGRDGSNINVAPGQLINFMIVFDKLPENCDSYEVEPLSSAPGN